MGRNNRQRQKILKRIGPIHIPKKDKKNKKFDISQIPTVAREFLGLNNDLKDDLKDDIPYKKTIKCTKKEIQKKNQNTFKLPSSHKRGYTEMLSSNSNDTVHESMDDLIDKDNDEFFMAPKEHLSEVLMLSDVIIEVLDVRDPLGTRCNEIEKRIYSIAASSLESKEKKIILLLNKIDLVPFHVVKAWTSYLSREYPTIPFKSSTQGQKKLGQQGDFSLNLSNSNQPEKSIHLQNKAASGINSLMQLLKQYSLVNNTPSHLTVGVVGMPNVGKSSVINSLKRTKAVRTAPVPGTTTHLQSIRLDSNLTLFDCPGVVLSTNSNQEQEFNLILRNCIPIEKCSDPFTAVDQLLKRVDPQSLISIYNLTHSFKDTQEFLSLVSQSRGKLLKGGLCDIDSTSYLVLQDYVSGKIPAYILPPIVLNEAENESKLLTHFSEGMDIKGKKAWKKYLHDHVMLRRFYSLYTCFAKNMAEDYLSYLQNLKMNNSPKTSSDKKEVIEKKPIPSQIPNNTISTSKTSQITQKLKFTPSYINLGLEKLQERMNLTQEMMQHCNCCGRMCDRNRYNGVGKCKTGLNAFISSYSPHFGEEAPLVGKKGSGTIFFTHCNLKCIYCQNYDISQEGDGYEVSDNQLAQIMLELQNKHQCHNINFVSPTHVLAPIMRALIIAFKKGLSVPLVWNTGGYDSIECLQVLDGIIDIYMPDMKYSEAEIGHILSRIPYNYPEINKQAVKEMHRQVGDLIIDSQGVAKRGLLIRHLVLPNNLAGTQSIMNFISQEISQKTYINIMDQYRPCHLACQSNYSKMGLNRSVTQEEMNRAFKDCENCNLHRLDTKRSIFRLFDW